jgi:hypothetical protein
MVQIRKYSLYLLAAVAFILLLGACACFGVVKARLGQEVSLPIGQSVVISGEGIEIRFMEVSEDSRCPKGVYCVWEGRVSALVEISADRSSEQLKLTQTGLTEQPASQDYKEYQLSFKVEPYPEAGREIAKGEYRLLLVVSK